MILKKVYNFHPGDHVRVLAGEKGIQPAGVAGIEVKFAPKGVKHLSQRWVDEGIAEEWLTFGKGKMIIAGADGDPVLELNVVRIPGHYCCHCGEKLPSDPQVKPNGMTTGQMHVKEKHGSAKSPDPTNPAGYVWETFYTVVNPGEVNNMTKKEAVEFEAAVRKAFHDKIHKSMSAAKKAG